MLKQGMTGVHDDCFFIPVVTDEELDNVMQAYQDAGMRARWRWTSPTSSSTRNTRSYTRCSRPLSATE